MSIFDPTKKHHGRDRFHNNARHAKPNLNDFLKFAGSHVSHAQQSVHFPKAENNPAWLKANRSEPSLTWIGHDTFLLQVEGKNILLDPHFSKRASPVQFAGPARLAPLGLTMEQLPAIDIVLISHNHYDHLDLYSVKRLAREHANSIHFFVPLGLKAWFAKQGIHQVIELDWWDSVKHQGFQIHATPVQHFSSRTATDRNKTLWAGWVMKSETFSFYFAGDTGYSQDFKETGERLGPFDLAALPIGAYDPQWFMAPMHVCPEDALRIFQDINTRYAVAMHWGTFRLTNEPMDEPPKRLAAALKSSDIEPERFFVMQHGETRKLEFLFNEQQN